MRILITGGSGFIGTNLVGRFVCEGLPVLNLDAEPPRNPAHRAYWEQVDIRDLPSLRAAIERFQPTHVAHMAARTDLNEKRSLDGYAANTEGVRNLIDVCSPMPNLQRVIFASSMLVCRNGYRPLHDTDYCPNTLYGQSKVAGESEVRNSGGLDARWVLVRPTSIWGPWFGPPYRDFFLTVARGRYWHPGKSNITKALGYVGNTVHQIRGLLLAPAAQVCGRTFYLTDDPPYTIREWAIVIQQTLEAKPIREAPIRLLEGAARLGDLSQWLGWESPPITSFRLRNMLTESNFDLKDLTVITGTPPFSLSEGVRETVAWLRATNQVKGEPAYSPNRESFSKCQ